jgi:hypothetical protein
VTPGDILAAGAPQVETGGYQLTAGDQTVPFTVR